MFRFLNKLFSSAAPQSSGLRDLLRQYCDELPAPTARNDHQKCLAVLGGVLEFAHRDRLPAPGLAGYTTDACLFELACYVLAATDIWTFNNAPEKRQKIQQILFSQLDAICTRSKFLPAEAAFEIANDRVGMYSQIASTDSPAEGLHLRLNQALKHATTHNVPPARINGLPPTFGDPFESLTVTKALVNWEMKWLAEMEAILCTIS